MTSFLIISKNKIKREHFALEYCQQKAIDPLDITLLDKDTFEKKDKKKPAQSIGIEDIKRLQDQLILKPIKSTLKASIIKNAQLLTSEAQNAMLKLLEEPPVNTLIFLTATTSETLLPTIISRCQRIEIQTDTTLALEEKEKITTQINQIQSLTILSCLTFAESLAKNKDETLIWLESMIIVLREQMLIEAIKEGNKKNLWYINTIREIQKTYRTLKTTNINARMTLENLLITLV